MNRRKWKSRRRRGHRAGGNLQNKVTVILAIVALSIFAGYFTANYLLGPILGLETNSKISNLFEKSDKKEETKSEEKEEKENVIEDQIETETESSGYALQYGSFSTKTAAEATVAELKRSGIETEIIEKDGAYKVIGNLFETEEEARTELEQQEGLVDVFLTQIP